MTVFINKGDPPLSYRQAVKRGLQLFEAEKQQHERETGMLLGSQEYLEWANQWLNDNLVNEANNIFNWQLADYRSAVARLAQYRLADGRQEETVEEPTGFFDDEGNEIVATIVTPAINPLPATIDVTTYNEAGEATVETVTNPAIVADDAERAAAQATIDATPEAVKTFGQ